MSSTPKVWFITGSSSGFGRSMVELLLNKGNKVVATLRNPDDLADLAAKYPTSQLVVVKLDVTRSSDVSAAFEKARQAFGRIDAVFNNAGQTQVGEVEGVPEEAARSVFEVNFWEAVRFFRDVNTPAGGRLLQLSSLAGIVGAPAIGFYSASLNVSCIPCPALEGLSECLSKEVDPAWNIKITIIEPGAFNTKIVTDNMKASAQHPAYADPKSPSSQTHADKAVAAMEELWAVALVKEKIQSVHEEVQAYESWSDDLYIN
ncbi:hypothetical protein BU15DRAFT_88303 [Melanogaster broomeanus]|nr:hypothetical protein BU15DRAFT_88303 [Melanogaster broomeanus]